MLKTVKSGTRVFQAKGQPSTRAFGTKCVSCVQVAQKGQWNCNKKLVMVVEEQWRVGQGQSMQGYCKDWVLFFVYGFNGKPLKN